MNWSEEEEGSRPQSSVRSAFSGSLRLLQELIRKVSFFPSIYRGASKALRKVSFSTSQAGTAEPEENDTNSTPKMPPSTMNSASSTSSPSSSTTRSSSGPVPSRTLSTPTPGPPEHHKLSCSLQELYTGSLRVLPHTSTTLHPDGTTTSSSHRFKVRILPGWKHGTTITFHNRGNILHPGHPAFDVVYTVEEQPHETFLREENDLIMRKKITLVEALTGCRFVVKTLDRRSLGVDVAPVIPVGFEVGIVGEGMPVAGELGRKGRLRVKFEVEFPKELSVEQKLGLKRLLDVTD